MNTDQAAETAKPGRWLRLDEASRYARVSTRTLRRAIRSGALPYRMPGKSYVLSTDDVDRWLEGLTRRHGPRTMLVQAPAKQLKTQSGKR